MSSLQPVDLRLFNKTLISLRAFSIRVNLLQRPLAAMHRSQVNTGDTNFLSEIRLKLPMLFSSLNFDHMQQNMVPILARFLCFYFKLSLILVVGGEYGEGGVVIKKCIIMWLI